MFGVCFCCSGVLTKSYSRLYPKSVLMSSRKKTLFGLGCALSPVCLTCCRHNAESTFCLNLGWKWCWYEGIIRGFYVCLFSPMMRITIHPEVAESCRFFCLGSFFLKIQDDSEKMWRAFPLQCVLAPGNSLICGLSFPSVLLPVISYFPCPVLMVWWSLIDTRLSS